MDLNYLITESYGTAKEKGWWPEDKERPIMEILMLAVSELAEAGEEYRKHGMSEDKFIYFEELPKKVGEDWTTYSEKPEGLAVELADCLIRIADFCGRYNIPLERALEMKLEYNKKRPFRHGGKKA